MTKQYVLKELGRYIRSGPTRKFSGCVVTEHKGEAMHFDTPEQAQDWLKEVKAIQRGRGRKPYELARGVVCIA